MVETIFKQDDLFKVVNALRTGVKAIGVDTETTGLNFMNKSIIMLQLGINDDQYIIDTRHVRVYELLGPYFEDPSIVKIIHNSAFDAPFMRRCFGFETINIWDSKLMENIILGIGTIPFEYRNREDIKEQYSTSLKYTLRRYGLAELDKETALTFLTIGDQNFTDSQITYGARDVESLETLMEMQQSEIDRLDLNNVAKLENRTAKVVADMRFYGINFDEDKWVDLAAKNEVEYNERIDELNLLTDGVVTNWNSPKQVKEYFLNFEGIQIESLSEFHSYQGFHQYSGMSDVLDKFADLRIRSYKYATTYGFGWLKTRWSKEEPEEPTVASDGRVHCNFNQIIDTGRFSCSLPNLQQIPNNWHRDPLYDHRTCFIPTEGYKFVSADFSGQELALMAAGSGEQSWIDILLSGDDLHSKMAEMLYRDRWKDAAEDDCEYYKSSKKCDCEQHQIMRQAAKTLDFGLPYGKGYAAMAEDLDVPVEESRRLLNKFKKSIPTLNRWLEDNGRYAVNHNESFTLPPFRRRRNMILEKQDWRKKNKGKNTPIQGSGADMMKLAMVLIDQYIVENKYPARILLCIHDEVLTETEEGRVDEWSKIVSEKMEEAARHITKLDLIKAKADINDYWKK